MNSGPSYYGEFYDWFNNIDGFGFCKCDMQWLESSFENYSANLKIVLMHHPAINSRDEKGEMHGVFAHYRKAFVELCNDYNIDLVLAGHTHVSKVFNDSEYSYVFNDSLNCSLYPTLFVQTDDCKHGINYRNVSIIGNDIWLENSVELEFIN
jgi:3',5'-cyclic AMP phosphodiesterase CpdA